MGMLKQGIQVSGPVVEAAWSGDRITPPKSGPIIGADVCKTRNTAQYPLPERDVITASGFYHHGGPVDVPCTEQMQPSATDIDELPWRRISFHVRYFRETRPVDLQAHRLSGSLRLMRAMVETGPR